MRRVHRLAAASALVLALVSSPSGALAQQAEQTPPPQHTQPGQCMQFTDQFGDPFHILVDAPPEDRVWLPGPCPPGSVDPQEEYRSDHCS